MTTFNQNHSDKKEEENLLSILISKYYSYWPAFIVSGVCCMAIAIIYLRYATPKFEATAKIIIKDEKKGTDDSKMIESMNMISTKKIIENEIEVLQSRKIINKVVKNLKLYAPIYVAGKFKDVSAFNVCPVYVECEFPDSIIKESKKIPFQINDYDSTIVMHGRYAGKVNQWINTEYGKIKFIWTNSIIADKKNKNLFFKLYTLDDVTDNILKNLTVNATNKLSSIINLSYKDEVSLRAKNILNELIRMYESASIEDKNSIAKNALQFIEGRLNIVSKNLDSIERTVQTFKKNNGASDLSMQGQLYLQNVSSNDQELGKINMQLAILQQVNQAVNNEQLHSIPMMPSTIGIADENLSKLLTELNNKELEYEKYKKTVAEDNPLLISLKDQINRIKPGIIENLESQRKNLAVGRKNLLVTNQQYNSLLSSLPQKEKTLLEINRDQAIKSSIYSFLLQKREESELSYASTLSDNRIINDAISSKYPVSPSKLVIYLSAILISAAICMLYIYSKENFSRKILFRNELSSIISMPVIGEISYKYEKDHKIIRHDIRSLIAEEFRKIRVSLHFLGIDDKHKKILVTSSIPGEGKSFVAANLAISNACAGKKVILIDVDLHQSGLHKIFEYQQNKLGLTDFLNHNANADDIISKISWQENLFYIHAGSILHNPSEILLNKRISQLLETLEQQFDLIILDSAPAELITDAFVLSKLCSATIYVVRHHFTPKIILKTINERLKINTLKNPGIVFNAVKKRGVYPTAYGYGYHNNKIVSDKDAKKLIPVKI